MPSEPCPNCDVHSHCSLHQPETSMPSSKDWLKRFWEIKCECYECMPLREDMLDFVRQTVLEAISEVRVEKKALAKGEDDVTHRDNMEVWGFNACVELVEEKKREVMKLYE